MMMEKSKEGSLIGGMFLVAGTAIGGGMLALPVITAEGGFWYTSLLYLLCWLFMACTGHLLMEVALYSNDEVNIVSMAQRTLGLVGKIFSWILYLFLFYALTIAYIAGGGNLIGYAAQSFQIDNLPNYFQPLLFTLLFAPFVIWGPKMLSRVNQIFVWGLIISFFWFVFIGIPHADLSKIQDGRLSKALMALPVLFTSFGFQGTVPTLANYLGRNAKKCALAIWLGSLIPLLTYVLWQALILGIVPLDSLLEARGLGETAIYPLKNILLNKNLFLIGQWFAFFAIVTSFFGVTLGMTDFLSDGFGITKNAKGKAALALLVFLLPLLVALANPSIFLNALHYAGGLGCALLLGLLPILMAWRGRYVLLHHTTLPLPGGKVTLSLLLSFVLIELIFTFLSVD